MNEYLTIEEVTKILKVSRTTVYTWMKSGELKTYKLGKLVRIKREDLERFIQLKERKRD